MNLEIIARGYISQIRPHAEAELDWFRQQPNLDAAIEKAALAINSSGRRYHHQRRLRRSTLEGARQALLANSGAIARARTFDDLFVLIDAVLKPIDGIGELYVYDTSLRIGAKLNLLPRKVYLHAGTRTGARAMGLDYNAEALEMKTLPPELQRLEPHEIEDVLCIFKDDLESIDIGSLRERSWCA